jgi:predicted small lipoprotein YifL
MKRKISFFLTIALVFTLTGCDWVRSTLGMPTSDELQRYKQLTEELDDSLPKVTPADTITVSPADSSDITVDSSSSIVQSLPSDMRFYVIAGSFSEKVNADKMASYLKDSGYSPIRLTFRNGYNVVASTAHKEIGDAYASLRKLLELDFSPEDIWIYDAAKQKLHIETK